MAVSDPSSTWTRLGPALGLAVAGGLFVAAVASRNPGFVFVSLLAVAVALALVAVANAGLLTRAVQHAHERTREHGHDTDPRERAADR